MDYLLAGNTNPDKIENGNSIFSMRRFLIFSLLLIFNIGVYAQLNQTFQLLPQPQSVKKEKGKGIRYNELEYIFMQGNEKMPVLGELLNRLPRVKRAGKGVVLQLTTKNVPESEEGYLLKVNKNGVLIKARTSAGLFYGCTTLHQLMEDSRDFNQPIPAMTISDYPAIPFRAMHIDSRFHMDRIEYYYQLIDRIASYKMNAIIWELEDKFKYTRRPEVAAANAINKYEMQAISRYAKERNIEISPLVQGLGHASFILKHHTELREHEWSDWEFCPANPKTYEFLFDMYSDAIEAFPYGKYLHIGGDEISSIGECERCLATGKTPFELQMEWLKKVCDFAVAHKRTPMFWDDMPLKYGEVYWEYLYPEKGKLSEEEAKKLWNTEKLDKAIELFPKDCVYMRWNYGDPTTPAHKRLMSWYAKKNLNVMAATAAGDAEIIMPRENSRANYTRLFSQMVAKNQLEGILVTDWDDSSPHFETLLRGIIAQAEYAWNPFARSVEEFVEAHAQREFGLPAGKDKMKFLRELEEGLFFFDEALSVSGYRNPGWGVKEFTLIDLPDSKQPGKWSETYKEKIKKAHQEKKRNEMIAGLIAEVKNEALRNRYTLEIYEQINYLQIYPSLIILALEQYDQATTAEARDEAKKEIKKVCDYFPVMRKNLETVYTRTRFLEQPSGFIMDSNFQNNISMKSLNSDWMYLYEIPMIEKVRDWMSNL